MHAHAAEITRFHSHVVCGLTASDCDIWTGAIGADGYGQLYLTREGSGVCVRPHRYALAIVSGVVAAGVLGLHECDNPVCVKISARQNPSARRVRPAGRQHGAHGADSPWRRPIRAAALRQSPHSTGTVGGAA